MITTPVYRVFALVLLAIIPIDSYSTDQMPDLLIAGKDTFCLYYTFPIDDLGFEKSNNPFKLYNSHLFISTNCWRGYQAIWKIMDGKFYLDEVKICNQDSIIDYSIVVDYFRESGKEPIIENGKVFADWYSTNLVEYSEFSNIDRRDLIGVDKIKKKHKKVFTIINGTVVYRITKPNMRS